MVELSRIELLTSWMQTRRSPSWAIAPIKTNNPEIGGSGWIWTTDLTLISGALYPTELPTLNIKKIDFGLLVFFLLLYYYQTTCVNTHAFLKEVIQPHLPVGLPCYDFTPVMNHTVVTVLTKLD